MNAAALFPCKKLPNPLRRPEYVAPHPWHAWRRVNSFLAACDYCGAEVTRLYGPFQARWGSPAATVCKKWPDGSHWFNRTGEIEEAAPPSRTCHYCSLTIEIRDGIPVDQEAASSPCPQSRLLVRQKPAI
jgi:hypothetical protein